MTAEPILADANALQVITRKEAMTQGLRHYYTGKPCINGHHSLKNLSGGCLECRRDDMREKRKLAAKPAKVLLSVVEKKRRKAKADQRYRIENPRTKEQKNIRSQRAKIRRKELLLAPVKRFAPESGEKVCVKCCEVKKIEKFSKHASHKDGLNTVCKACKSAYVKTLFEKNPEFKARTVANAKKWVEENRDRHLARQKSYHKVNKDQRNLVSREWKLRNPEKNKQIIADYRENHKDRLREYSKEYIKEKIKNNPVFAMKNRVRILILNQIRAMGYTKRSRTHEILGCNWEFFKRHIELQFPKGMTWDNRGDWHIDHIIPLATASTEDDVMALNRFTNLRPMWAKDNLSKGAQITHLI